jgi:hypothetical protein
MDAEVWREAKGVLAEALLCPPDMRDAWVVERCPDPLLRREVEACLHQYDEKFLETVLTVSTIFDLATPSDADQAPDVQPGEHIGPHDEYVVLERLGVGGMGHVFLGRDTRLHRKVALKCLIASASGSDLRSKILHEARAAARINHPNIAVVHDVIDHDGRPFLVMEYVEGENLAVMLRRERPPIDRILVMGRQLASALGAAHAQGIIHRDLKPANIQVMPGGSVKILDFGVAHAMSTLSTEPSSPSTTNAMPLSTVEAFTRRGDKGAVVHPGTPAYMSPEQMFGKEIDQRSDIYSLGVVLYEMVTGHRPYSTEDPLDVVLALSRRLLRPTGAEANLPAEVGDVIGKMLAVNVEERYQTAAELETALAALIGADPTALPVHLAQKRSWTKTAVRIAAAVIFIPLFVGGLGFSETAAFNLALERVAPFDVEPATRWMEMGARSLFVPLLYQLGIFMIVAAAGFAVRMLSLSKGINRLLTTGRTRTLQLSSKLGLDDPAELAQAVATICFVALVILSVAFRDVIRAWMARINTYPSEQLLPLRPGNRTAQQTFQFLQCVLVFVLSAAVFRVVRLRARQQARSGTAPLGILVAMLTFTIVMLVLPYRIINQAQFERVDVISERCYILGEHADDWLVYCPDHPPPRNRIIKSSDPAAKRLGGYQNIFTPTETFH